MRAIVGMVCVLLLWGGTVSASELEMLQLQHQIGQALAYKRLLTPQVAQKAEGVATVTYKPHSSRPQEGAGGPTRIKRFVNDAAFAYRLPPELLMALIKVESDFNPRAVSRKGCIGLTQLAPATAAELGVDPWDPRQNVWGGAAYLRMMYDRYGSVEEALWAYNAGPGRVDRAFLPSESRAYVYRVMEYWQRYR